MKKCVDNAKVTILSTQIASYCGIAEWGFSALIEADSSKVLFDTGGRKETVFINGKELMIDLSDVRDVVLSHSHNDHINGLVYLRKKLKRKNESAVDTTWVAKYFFEPWVFQNENVTARSPAGKIKTAYGKLGGRFIEIDDFRYVHNGIALTGPIPRIYEEKNWPRGFKKYKNEKGELLEWTIPDDQAVIINAKEGVIVITGCGHSGIINTLDYVSKKTDGKRVLAVIGGLHLYEADEKTVLWTAEKIRQYRIPYMIATHCTGIGAAYRLRDLLGMDKEHFTIGAVGTRFESGKGIVFSPGAIER